MPESELAKAQDELEWLFQSLDLKDIDSAFRAYQGDNPWLKQGIANYLNGCPATAHVIMRQLALGGQMSLKEVVEWELKLAKQAVRHQDFAEGIRAMWWIKTSNRAGCTRISTRYLRIMCRHSRRELRKLGAAIAAPPP